MKETPAWRMLGGSGYVDEGGNDNGARGHLKKIIKFAKHNYASQGYPLGGIQNITSSILNSIPKNKTYFKTSEKAVKPTKEFITETSSSIRDSRKIFPV